MFEIIDDVNIYREEISIKCDDCKNDLNHIILTENEARYLIKNTEPIIIMLCKKCYHKKEAEELMEIAREASKIVLEDLKPLVKHSDILKERGIIKHDIEIEIEIEIEDLKKFMELKQLLYS